LFEAKEKAQAEEHGSRALAQQEKLHSLVW